MTINLSTNVLTISSIGPPGIDADSLFGTAIVWTDPQNGAVTLGVDQSSPPFAPIPLNPAWTSLGSPAIALATDWDVVFVAFTDKSGRVQLASSQDGWAATQTLGEGGVGAGPAIAYADDILYIAWQTANAQLGFAACDQNGQITYFQSDKPLSSRPTICVDDPDRIYVLGGGSVEFGARPVQIYLSVDGGKNFSAVKTPQTMCIGPPSLVLLDQFYLAWTDAQTNELRLAQTADLGTFTAMQYSVRSEGGPAIVPMVTLADINNPASWVFSLSAAWTVFEANSHVAIGSFGPLNVAAAQRARQKEEIARRTAPHRQADCPDPSTVWDPVAQKCVSKLGCWGGCVLSSMVRGAFNPFVYAWCVAKCESSK